MVLEGDAWQISWLLPPGWRLDTFLSTQRRPGALQPDSDRWPRREWRCLQKNRRYASLDAAAGGCPGIHACHQQRFGPVRQYGLGEHSQLFRAVWNQCASWRTSMSFSAMTSPIREGSSLRSGRSIVRMITGEVSVDRSSFHDCIMANEPLVLLLQPQQIRSATGASEPLQSFHSLGQASKEVTYPG